MVSFDLLIWNIQIGKKST